ncbi:hypothetical protein BKA63DRAFT_569324 [Paraphoma chrysanthemicola]|nr:hypothetical protein BKA63DRAFT_569324 [Paraphoma chrysanthemicola]
MYSLKLRHTYPDAEVVPNGNSTVVLLTPTSSAFTFETCALAVGTCTPLASNFDPTSSSDDDNTMILHPEPVGLPDDVRRVMYAYHHAVKLMKKWNNPNIPNKRLMKERYGVIRELRHEVEIKVHDNSDSPRRFAQSFEPTRYDTVFANHQNLHQDDFRLADLTNLRKLSLVSGHCLRHPSVKPGEVVKETARKFYGDFVGGENFDLANPPATMNTTNSLCPALLSGFRTPSPPSAPADPASGRGVGYGLYSHYYRRCKDGGLRASNAITHHAMAEMHTLLVATPYIHQEFVRISNLLAGWLQPGDHMLDVTPFNSSLSQEDIDAIDWAERRARNPGDEPGQVDLAPKHQRLNPVNFQQPQYRPNGEANKFKRTH